MRLTTSPAGQLVLLSWLGSPTLQSRDRVETSLGDWSLLARCVTCSGSALHSWAHGQRVASVASVLGPLSCLLTGNADALIVGEAAEHARGRANQRHTLLGGDMLRTEPRVAPATADHRVLVTADSAARSLALRRNEGCYGRVKWLW